MNIEATAYHEAGHAVAHFAFGLPFDKVTIIPDDECGSDGAVHHPVVIDPDSWDVEEDEREILIDKHVLNCYIAGLAEERYIGAYNTDGAGQDRRDAVDYASRRCGSNDELEAYLNWIFVRARNFINRPVRWLQIQAVAHALLDRQELTQDETVAIIRKASGL